MSVNYKWNKARLKAKCFYHHTSKKIHQWETCSLIQTVKQNMAAANQSNWVRFLQVWTVKSQVYDQTLLCKVKTLIELHMILSELCVKGDTYPHKDLLKHMKFKWDPIRHIWHRTCGEQSTVDYIMKMFEVNNICISYDNSVKCHPISIEQMQSIRTNLFHK